jgi:hypothetical protein
VAPSPSVEAPAAAAPQPSAPTPTPIAPPAVEARAVTATPPTTPAAITPTNGEGGLGGGKMAIVVACLAGIVGLVFFALRRPG